MFDKMLFLGDREISGIPRTMLSSASSLWPTVYTLLLLLSHSAGLPFLLNSTKWRRIKLDAALGDSGCYCIRQSYGLPAETGGHSVRRGNLTLFCCIIFLMSEGPTTLLFAHFWRRHISCLCVFPRHENSSSGGCEAGKTMQRKCPPTPVLIWIGFIHRASLTETQETYSVIFSEFV